MVGNARTLEMLRAIARRNKKLQSDYEDRFGTETEDDEVKNTFGNTGEASYLEQWATDPRDAEYLARMGVEEI